MILAAAGLLDGKRATSHWAALTALKALGVKAVGDERIVIADGAAKDGAAKDGAAKDAAAKDGAAKNDTAENTIVTCAGVSAGIDLGLWLAGRIGGDGRAKVIQLSMEYDPEPSFDSGHMSGGG